MIIYGTRAAHLGTVQSNNAVCPNCETQRSIVYSIFRKHAHIFWVPLFPYSKVGVSQCQHCKQTLEPKQMPVELKSEYKQLKSEMKGPVWQFAGLAIFPIIVLSIIVAGNKSDAREYELISSPEAGDVYEISIGSKRYSTLKVNKVMGDSVYVIPNEYETNKLSGIYEIDVDTNYAEYYYATTIKSLQEMHDSGEIVDVNRK